MRSDVECRSGVMFAKRTDLIEVPASNSHQQVLAGGSWGVCGATSGLAPSSSIKVEDMVETKPMTRVILAQIEFRAAASTCLEPL